MKYGFFIFLFIALAMTVMSAPAGKTKSVANTAQGASKKTKSAAAASSRNAGAVSKKSGGKKKHTICKRAQAALIEAKKKPYTSRPPGAKGAKKTGRVRRDFNATTFETELFRRSDGTKLCGLKLRAKTVGMCRGNPAYLYDRGTRTSIWYHWDTIENLMTPANIPSKYQCDHALELQLTAAALTASGFCTAWDEMRAAWKKYKKRAKVDVKVDDIMSNLFYNGGFKGVVNHPTMLFFVDKAFNERKRAFTASAIRGSVPASTTELQNYFHAGVVGIVDGIATAIDEAAYNLLNAINARATPENYDEDTASEAAKELVCALDSAQTVTFRSWEKPVQSYWGGMKEVLFPAAA